MANTSSKAALLDMAVQRELNAKYFAITALQMLQSAIDDAKMRADRLPPVDAIRAIMHGIATGNLNATMELKSAMSRMHEASIIRLSATEAE